MLQLRGADPAVVKKAFGVVVQRTVYELNGISCIQLEPERKVKQQIIRSRMFGHAVTDPAIVELTPSMRRPRVISPRMSPSKVRVREASRVISRRRARVTT
jgi:DNA polymerase V